MVHELQNLTGINPQSIPFNDARALSVFCSTDALGITPSKLADVIVNGKVTVGTLGLRGMEHLLQEEYWKMYNQRTSLIGKSVRLPHGTGVWRIMPGSHQE